MTMLLILLLQAFQIFAINPGNYRRSRNYRYGKHTSLKRQTTAMTLYPRCRSDPTILDIHVLDQNGRAVGRSKLWLVSSSGMTETWTGHNGQASVQVTGCQVGIIAWLKGQQSKHQLVNLERSEKNKKKVVIKLNAACNFLIKAVFSLERFKKSDLVSYVVHSGGLSTSGNFVGGHKSSPACLSVKEGDSVYMTISSQSTEVPNILYLTDVKEGMDALVTVPFPIKTGEEFFKNVGRPPKLFSNYWLMVTTNVWKLNEGGLSSTGSLEQLNRFDLVTDSSDNAITGTYEFTTAQIFDDFDRNKVYLVVVGFDTVADNMKGNAVLYDKKRNMKVLEYPGGPFSGTDDGHRWILGCMRDCLDTFKETNEVMDGDDYPEDVSSYCNMN